MSDETKVLITNAFAATPTQWFSRVDLSLLTGHAEKSVAMVIADLYNHNKLDRRGDSHDGFEYRWMP